jgi:hypothetical protein
VGAVNLKSRSFQSLIRTLSDQEFATHLRRLKVGVAGGGPDRTLLEELVAANGLVNMFRFAPVRSSGFVDYSEYFNLLQESDFILPLLRFTFTDYWDCKISSVIPTAFALSIPAPFDYWTAIVYGVPSVEPNATLSEVLLRLEQMEQEEMVEWQERFQRRRLQALTVGHEEWRRALKRIGILP